MTELDHATIPDLPQKPESWDALVANMSPQIHGSLKTAVELGRWPNGDRLTREQVEYCMQAIIAWDNLHLPDTERVGYIDRERLTRSQCDD